jgi:hypothetical protein
MAYRLLWSYVVAFNHGGELGPLIGLVGESHGLEGCTEWVWNASERGVDCVTLVVMTDRVASLLL